MAETEGKKRVRKRFTKETLRPLHPPPAPQSLHFFSEPPSLRPEGFSLHNKTTTAGVESTLERRGASSLKKCSSFF